MNKKYAAFFTEKGLNVEGNRAYGKLNGYETNVIYNALDSVSPLILSISCYTTDEQKRTVEAEIRNAKLKFCRTAFTRYGLSVGLNGMTAASLLKRLPELFEFFYKTLENNGALNAEYCPVCGNKLAEDSYKTCTVDGGVTVTIDNDCIENINSVIDAENQDFSQAPNNYLRGFLGALIGGIVGGLVAGALYAAGYIASISAFIALMLGTFLYGKFGGKKNKMMVVIVSLTTVVCMLLSVFIIYLIATAVAINEYDLYTDAFSALFYLLKTDPEVSRAFWLDMVLSLVFTVVGIGYEIFILLRSVKRPTHIK